MTLYRFTRDPINAGSACYGTCAASWPPLLVDEGKVPLATEGVDGKLLGVFTRTDGTRQVMYNGMPLYYYHSDDKAGQINGQRRGNVWFIVHPNTTTIGGQGVTLREAKNEALGPILTDGAGMTLYLFTRDSENHSVCYDGCATAWPPLLVSTVDNVGLDGIGGTVGTALRDDGNNQVTYAGKPLYYWFRDTKPAINCARISSRPNGRPGWRSGW
jgi:predicted lipoprotein with Yx(FWY)xxD motif